MEILHFNDIYNIVETNENQIGAAHLATLIKRSNQNISLILLSGESFVPSYLGIELKGYMTLEVLNTFSKS